MTTEQRHALAIRETDIDGAIKRFNGNEQLYISCLIMFLDDPTVSQLNDAVAVSNWDDAFTAAHALKGMSGNMGFVQLMHAASSLVISIRSGRTGEVGEGLDSVNRSHRSITETIRRHFTQSTDKG